MRARYYAKALYDLSLEHEGKEEALMRRFVAAVTANRHTHLLPKIIKSYERIVAKAARMHTIEVTSATPISEADVAALLKKAPFKEALTTLHKRVVRKTDPTLVGGAIVRTGTMRIDGSYKRMLRELYQETVANL